MAIDRGRLRRKVSDLLSEGRRLERHSRERIEASRARIQAAVDLETPDRIPVRVGLSPAWSDWYLKKRYGIRIGEYWRDPELCIEYQLRTWIDSFRDFDDDRTSVLPGSVGPLGGVVLHPSIAGCRAAFPQDDFAWIDLGYRAFDTEEKIDDFETPEISGAGLMPETIARLDEIERAIGDLIPVSIQGGDGAPLQMAAYTRGIRELIRDMYTRPEIADKLLDKMVDVYRAIQVFYEETWGVGYRGAGVEGYFYDNPLAYFSPPLVERFVLPRYRRFAEECGWRHWSFETQDVMDGFLELFRTVPIRNLHNLVSNSNLVAFRKVLDPREVCLHVFMAPGRLVQESRIHGEVRRVFDCLGREEGWLLSSGVVDTAVSESSIHEFIRAARSLGTGD